MIDFSKMKVDDIKQLIVNEEHMTVEQLNQLNIRGKSGWVGLYKQLNGIEDPTFVFEQPEETLSKIESTKPQAPLYSDIGWQDYVMSHFAPNELVDGKYPSVNGLRRVVDLLLGEIMSSGPVEVKTTMDPDHTGKAVVVYEICIAWKLNAGPYISLNDTEPYPIKKFQSIASSSAINTDDTYAIFPEAIAEVRAEGRALRKALRLAVVCADELTRKNATEIVKRQTEKITDGSWEESSIISDNQVNSIKILCDRLGIDMFKFINSGSKQYKDILEVSRQTAANMIKRLNEYQNASNESVNVPVDILLER